jgi:formylmethanofuran dehydrogenase subunit D
VECTWHIFGTQVEDQDQIQDGDGDKVKVLVTFGNILVERKQL